MAQFLEEAEPCRRPVDLCQRHLILCRSRYVHPQLEPAPVALRD